MIRSLNILFCMFQGGGNTPLILPVLAELIARRHKLRVIAGPGVRASRLDVSSSLLTRLTGMGAELIPFHQPDVHPFDTTRFNNCGLVGSWTPSPVRNVQREAQTAVWAPPWALNVANELRREKADLVVADFVLLGALIAAEASQVPHVALMHTVYPWPVPGVPPYGPGLLPKGGLLGYCRDAVGRAVVERLWKRTALAPVNSVRSQLGLAMMPSPLQQYDTAARVLVLVSEVFDWPAHHYPANVRHVGTPGDNAGLAHSSDEFPVSAGDGPLIVVSLSTLNQGQADILKQVIAAIAGLPMRALVTLGPALASDRFDVPANVRVETFVSHDVVLPHAAALVTQCGIGTITKALRHGVPMICLPLVGDQPDNAARIVARGAGIWVRTDVESIRSSIIAVVGDKRFREAAIALGRTLSSGRDPAQRAADEIELSARSIKDRDAPRHKKLDASIG